MKNLFENIPEHAPEELVTELLSAENVRIERIVSFGQASADGFWYDQPEHEWVILLEGTATIRFEDGTVIDLMPGEFLNIPVGCRHRVEKTAQGYQTIWLAVFIKTHKNRTNLDKNRPFLAKRSKK